MTLLHILWTPSIGRPWWRTDERCDIAPGDRIWTDCCGCKMPAEQTDTRLVTSYDPPLGDSGCYQEQMPWTPDSCDLHPDPPTGAYYEPRWETRCAAGCGCTVRPSKKNGRELREYWRWDA